MYDEYHNQARRMTREIIQIVRRYGMEYDLDVASVIGVLEIVKQDVFRSAVEDLEDS
jgi:hypothetical protein